MVEYNTSNIRSNLINLIRTFFSVLAKKHHDYEKYHFFKSNVKGTKIFEIFSKNFFTIGLKCKDVAGKVDGQLTIGNQTNTIIDCTMNVLPISVHFNSYFIKHSRLPNSMFRWQFHVTWIQKTSFVIRQIQFWKFVNYVLCLEK